MWMLSIFFRRSSLNRICSCSLYKTTTSLLKRTWEMFPWKRTDPLIYKVPKWDSPFFVGYLRGWQFGKSPPHSTFSRSEKKGGKWIYLAFFYFWLFLKTCDMDMDGIGGKRDWFFSEIEPSKRFFCGSVGKGISITNFALGFLDIASAPHFQLFRLFYTQSTCISFFLF